MRRFSFRRVAAEEEEAVEDEKELFEEGGGDLYYSRIAGATPRLRRSFHRSSSAISSALSSFVCSRKSFSYDKLNQVPIQLSIVKLDGSSFEVDVSKMATIADLKVAVERAFCHLPAKGVGKISWRHVWGHFCLSFCGHKLLSDGDSITDYGIKDGDQLRFVRHVSIAYNLIKKRSRKRIEAPKPHTLPEDYDLERHKVLEDYYLEGQMCREPKYEVEDNSTQNESLLAHLFRGWFIYSRLSSKEDVQFEENTGHSRWAGGFVGCFRSIFQFCDNRPPSYSSRVSQVQV